MNTKLSGAQLVLVPIQNLGANRFPMVENLRDRVIKYIDFYPCAYLPGVSTAGVTSSQDMYITIKNVQGNMNLHDALPLARLDYTQTLGVRTPIFSKIGLQPSFVDCQDASQIGKVAAFVFWYDLPQYSQRNATTELITDAVSVPLTTAIRYNLLPDNERMNGKRFRRILLGTPTTTPDLQTGLDASKLANVYLTLRRGSYNIIQDIPVMLLYQMQMMEKSEFQNIIFDFHSSYLTIGGAGTIPNVLTDYIGKSVFFNLQYEK